MLPSLVPFTPAGIQVTVAIAHLLGGSHQMQPTVVDYSSAKLSSSTLQVLSSMLSEHPFLVLIQLL